jgi:Domain of unknown function (DUF4330)
MAILDRQGRLFGKFSLLDIGAVLVMLFVVAGIFLSPGSGGRINGQDKAQSVEADLLVKGLKMLNPESLAKEFSPGTQLSFVIRNQPAGQVTIKSVRQLERDLLVITQPDGSVKIIKDPRPYAYSVDAIFTVTGKGQKTKEGLVLGNTKMKIGSPVEIDQLNYNFNGTTIDIRYLDK